MMEERLYKIGEVCRMADVQPYVLRYWETEFPQLAPNKSGGGQRLYTKNEIDVILRIKQLLYSEGFTIAGAKKKLETELNEPAAVETPAAASPPPVATRPSPAFANALVDVKRELGEILELLSSDQPAERKSATIRSRPARSSSSKASS
jgi:DNA-binding transcriptional MerR regulator